MKTIYFGGGCFWGAEQYFQKLKGVVGTEVGYANSKVESPDYKLVCTGTTGAVEAVKVEYDETVITLQKLIEAFFRTIDPTTLNKQGHDVGEQYRSGVYYTDPQEKSVIENVFQKIQKNYKQKIVTEILEIQNFYKAEEYHQKYLVKNPHGYCHNMKQIEELMKSEDYNGK